MAALLNNRAWWILAVLAVVAGTAWRASHLESRPLHADEAVQAWQTWRLLDGEGYRYDPYDRHGPSLYFGAAWLHQLRGGKAADFDDRDARRFSLALGVATLALLGFGTGSIGLTRATGAVAAALLAFETMSSVYHTYFVQEATLAFLIWAFVFTLVGRRERDFSHGSMLVMGLIIGLAQATKEITPLYVIMALGAWWVSLPRADQPEIPSPRGLALLGLGCLLPYALFYSSFGQNIHGVSDGLKHYFLQISRLQESPHEYPWWYHLRYLGILPSGGPRWGQYGLLALAVGGGALAWRKSAPVAARTVATFTGSLLFLHSVVAYKTPWLLLTSVIGLVILAAYCLVVIGAGRPWRWALAGVILVASAGQSLSKSRLALERYPGDVRNPYFYVQTPRAFARLPDRLANLEQANDGEIRVAVVSAEHAWPLPWYLRDASAVGYFESPPSDFQTWDVVLWDSQLGDPPMNLGDNAVIEFYGLRPGVLLHCFIRQPVWEKLFPPLKPQNE